MSANHNPTHPKSHLVDTGATWLTPRPAWARGPHLQTELVTHGAESFWIAYPLPTGKTTTAERVAAASGRGATIGEALRKASA